MSVDQLVDVIKKLSRKEQEKLVDPVVEGFSEASDPKMDREHLAIIVKRMKNSGESIPGDAVLRRIRERLPK
jgi:hypothetical protein